MPPTTHRAPSRSVPKAAPTTTAARIRLPQTAGHWERGHLTHTYWSPVGGLRKAALIRQGPAHSWDGVYRWSVPHAGLRGEAATLDAAKRAALQALACGHVQLEMLADAAIPPALAQAVVMRLDETIGLIVSSNPAAAIQCLHRARAMLLAGSEHEDPAATPITSARKARRGATA